MRRVPEQNLPEAIRQRATKQRLGALQRIYVQGHNAWFYCLPGLICILFGSLLPGAFFLYYTNTFSWWPAWQAYLIPAIGVCWLVFGIWLLLTPLFSPRIHAYIFARGLIYQKRKISVIHWNQVETLWKAYKLHGKSKERRYTLQCQGGSTFVLSSQLEEFELLGQFLDKVVKRRWLPAYIMAYYRGEELHFQELLLDKQSLSVRRGGKSLPWPFFDGTKLDETMLSIFAKYEHVLWAVIPAERLPNVEVLHNLLEHILHDLARRSEPQVVAYHAGIPVSFGKLSISQQGITLDNTHECLPWSEVASIGLGESEVIIRRQGTIQEWHAIPLWAITNASALNDLLEHILLNQFV